MPEIIRVTVRNGRTAEDGPARFFHGGVPGLKPGDKILPANETGMTTLGEVEYEYGLRAGVREHGGWRPDKVYVGTATVALLYAGLWTLSPMRDGEGQLYEVRPVGQLTADPAGTFTWWGRQAWLCASATVIRSWPPLTREFLLAREPRCREYEAKMAERYAAWKQRQPVPASSWAQR